MTDTNSVFPPQDLAAEKKCEEIVALIESMTDMTVRETQSRRIKAALARRAEATSERCQDFRFGFS